MIWSDALAARTRAAVRIGTLHDRQVLIVHHVFSPDDGFQALDVGSLLPAHATALGKVLLAHHPFALSEIIHLGLASFTDATVSEPERLEEELGQVAERGWAAERGELRPERASIAAPITDRTDRTVGAIGIFGSCEQLLTAGQPRRELVDRVRDAGRAVSRELGAIRY
jgi:DNA-binding IclR family transcriptional regulator